MTQALPILSLVETRVLGVLAEKQRTVPDSYPLTLNSLVSGCNQKTSRNPVLELSEAQVQAAIDSLKGYSLVAETSGGRAFRYEHNIDRVLRIPSQSVILLTVLMLRGPQTAGELRIACDRMHNFADISSVEGFLDELAERPASAREPLGASLERCAGGRACGAGRRIGRGGACIARCIARRGGRAQGQRGAARGRARIA